MPSGPGSSFLFLTGAHFLKVLFLDLSTFTHSEYLGFHLPDLVLMWLRTCHFGTTGPKTPLVLSHLLP